ncbi:metallophosphoesterase [Rhizobium ruizarguesonis]
MKIWPISDLHLEFGVPFKHKPPEDVDVVVCAGDVLTRGIVPSIEWLERNFGDIAPIIFVAGNHEFYSSSVKESLVKAEASPPGVHFLENNVVEIGDVAFVGGTLWSDFRLFGFKPEVAMSYASHDMNDYKKIKFSKTPYVKFKPTHSYRKHVETRDFIASELRKRRGQKVVVVTHHAPSPRSIANEFRTDPLSASYASDLEELIFETGPALWVHGHVHHRNDYLLDACRVVSNPRGYPGEPTNFDPLFTVDILVDPSSKNGLTISALAILDRAPDINPDPGDELSDVAQRDDRGG